MPSKVTSEATIDGRRIRYTGHSREAVEIKKKACVRLQARNLAGAERSAGPRQRPVRVRVNGMQRCIGMATTPQEVDAIRVHAGYTPVRRKSGKERPPGHVRVYSICKFVLEGIASIVSTLL